MMTVGEHDSLWMKGANSIINSERHLDSIQQSLRIKNAIEIAKELHSIGAIPDEDYKEDLIKFLKNEGFTWVED